MIDLLKRKVFLKRNINALIHIFFLQLFLLLFTLLVRKKIYPPTVKIRLCTTKIFFWIESIKICDDLNNENNLDQIKCHKNFFLYLKLILLLSGDVSLNPETIQNDHLKENWKTFRSRGLHFMRLNINSLLLKIDQLREIVKISNSTVIGITETKIDN